MMERNCKTIICKMVLLVFLGLIYVPLANASDVRFFSNSSSANSSTGTWVDGFISGKVHKGKAVQGSKTWPFTIRITEYNETTGSLVGELAWTTLNSIHLIRGTLNGSTLTFKEEEAIKPGGAHLNVVYTMRISSNNATGTWVDQGDKSIGDVLISGTSSNSGSLSTSKSNNTGTWVDGFIGGKVHKGKAVQGSKTWPFTIRITEYNETTGSLVGELAWTTLNSIHLIRGTLNGSTLTFKEEEAIKPGGAHLNVVYTMRISSNNATGTWVDQGDKSIGDVLISGTSSNSGSLSTSKSNNTGTWVDGFIGGKVHKGKAVQGSKTWPFTIRITEYNETTGSLVGELAWTTLNSIHLIRGTLNGSTLTFKEEEAIKPGGAHLNVVYTMRISSNNATGTWVDQGDKSIGDVLISGQ